MPPDDALPTPKRDAYLDTRGGTIQFLDLHCGACDAHVALYQKDGPGPLWRIYLDRIFAPEALAALQDTVRARRDIPDLICPICGKLLGVADVYASEARLCIRLRRGQVVKRVRGTA